MYFCPKTFIKNKKCIPVNKTIKTLKTDRKKKIIVTVTCSPTICKNLQDLYDNRFNNIDIHKLISLKFVIILRINKPLPFNKQCNNLFKYLN